MGWFKSARAPSGWMAVGMEGDSIALVQGDGLGARPRVSQLEMVPFDPERGNSLAKISLDYKLKRQRCTTLLKNGEYQLQIIEAPKVAADEIHQAVRWHVKDLLDHPIEEVTLDVLDVPIVKDDVLANHYIYVVAAPNQIIRDRMARFQGAKIGIEVIDIPETAQRNIATLYEERDQSVALVYLGDDGALLTVSNGGELYLARRIEISLSQLTGGLPPEQKEAQERLLDELQRSLDHFERQYRTLPIGKLVLGPTPGRHELDFMLHEALGLPVDTIDLKDVIDFPAIELDAALQWTIFHTIGAALRVEQVAA